MSRQNRTSELKNRVLTAALAHFTESGIERSNVGDILKDAECSVGSLYHHFGNKEGIAEALFINGLNQFNDNLLDALLRHQQTEPGIKSIVSWICRWVTEQPQIAAYMLSREIKLSEEAKQELRELDQSQRDALTGWFAPRIESGELKNLHFNVYVPLISGPALEYSRMWLSGRYTRSPETVSNVMAEAAWQSVRQNQGLT